MKLKPLFNFIGIVIFFFFVSSVYADSALICYRDFDEDGYGNAAQPLSYSVTIPVGYVLNADDCDDTNPLVHPGALEICYDLIDNNCDGEISESCAQITTQIRPIHCNTILPALNYQLRATSISLFQLPSEVVVNAYRFKIKNLSTNQTDVVQKSLPIIQLVESSVAMYDCAFQVEVAIQLNNEWMPYGASCIVFSPPLPNTVMDEDSCNLQLPQMNSIIRAVPIPMATHYKFEVSLIEDGIPIETVTLIKTGASLNLLLVDGISKKFNVEYRISVKVEGLTANGLVWSTSYGPPCSVFSPTQPEVWIEGCDEEAGLHPANLTTVIYTKYVGGVTYYRYTLSHEDGYSQTISSNARTFRLSSFNQLSPLTPGATYSLSVETMIYGYYYFGKDCNVKVPGGSGLKENLNVSEQFEDNYFVYPNPSDSFFTIHTNHENEGKIVKKVRIDVYDNFGRIIEKRELKSNESFIRFGENLSSGIYYLRISDDNTTWSKKIIKR